MNMALYSLWNIYASVSVDDKKLADYLIYAGHPQMGYQKMQQTVKECTSGKNEYVKHLKEILGLAFPGKKISFFYFHGDTNGWYLDGGRYFKDISKITEKEDYR